MRILALLLFSLCASAWTTECLARTTLIHAVGISLVSPGQNQDGFYNDAQDFLSYCKLAHLNIGSDCKLYINLEVPRKAGLAPDLKPELTAGAFRAKTILEDFKTALQTSNPGDQVVFSMHDHGAPGLFDSSCVFGLSSKYYDRAICLKDVKEILSKYKKPGVRVFLNVDACYSGAFSALSTNEVCTLVGSDRSLLSYGSNFWHSALETKKDGGPTSLTGISPKLLSKYDADISANGGGFGSDVIKAHLCEKKNSVTELMLENDLEKKTRSRIEDLANELAQMRTEGRFCSRVSSNTSDSDLINLAEQIGYLLKERGDEPANAIQRRDADMLAGYKNRCSSDSQKNSDLCKGLLDYQRVYDSLTKKGDLLAIEDAFRANLNSLYNKDQDLIRRAKSARTERARKRIENKRWKLYRQYNSYKKDFAAKINAQLDSAPFQNLLSSLQRLRSNLCFDQRDRKAMRSGLNSHLPLFSSLTGEEVPTTNPALNEARQCESSFVLP